MSLPGLYTHLAATAGVTNLVSTRIEYGVLAQDSVYPAIVLQQISGVREVTMGGLGGSGVAHPRIQISCWAETQTAVAAVADAVRVATNGYRGAMGTTTVLGVILQDEHDSLDHDVKSGRRYYGIIQDYEIWHKEATT